MPGIARQFEPQITRSGGAPSKFRFKIRCSECASTDVYEASKPTGTDVVKGYFNERGWLLGRAPSFDVCSACLGRPRHAQKTKSAAPRPETRAADKRHQDTADILARHLGKPEALAAEVFRPKEAKPPQSPTPKALQPAHPTPALSPEVEQTLAEMAADLKGLRSAMELMADQVNKLVTLGGQQIEAITRLAPALLESTEGLSGDLRQVIGAIQVIPQLANPVADQPSVMKAEASPELTPSVDAEPAPVPELEVQEAPRRAGRKRKAEPKEGQIAAAVVVVKSIGDAKRPDRFYTSIRLPRALWDSAGFGPDDRLLLDWSGKALTIERATEGGVKPKSIGDTSVVLQSWKLGNLNFDQLKVTGANGSLRLAAGRKRSET
ncbi:hypothetical protein [Microvirga subterranea]|uniref:Uncharacterized protein n=1 Tax=Microvirga subterranea TaxID=186651 RepID=A0A370HA87_9HYPH|nr:hypothetical protein [Microvirga subterranea]RDI53848.1 hypothetical protein DES45_11252 [Microvirga subterranea]